MERPGLHAAGLKARRKAQVEKLETVPTGGLSGIYITHGEKLYSVGIRPLFPDEVAAEDLDSHRRALHARVHANVPANSPPRRTPSASARIVDP